VRSEPRLLVTVVAYALISAHHVLTDTVRAYATGSRAFVDVLAGLLIGAQFMPRWALTTEAPFSVDAASTATQSWRLLALIYVWNI